MKRLNTILLLLVLAVEGAVAQSPAAGSRPAQPAPGSANPAQNPGLGSRPAQSPAVSGIPELSPGAARQLGWEGNRAYQQGDFPLAASLYDQAMQADPALAESAFNRANSSYQQQDFADAARRFGELASRQDLPAGLRAGAYYNQGNAWFEAGDYAKAVSSYQQALRHRPGDADAKHNLALARLRQQQEQQQEQNQNQEQQEDQNQEQQEQNQDQQNGDEGQDQQQEQPKPGEEPSEQDGGQQQDQPRERNMSPEELERILDALEQDEKDVQEKINAQRMKGPRVATEKDW